MLRRGIETDETVDATVVMVEIGVMVEVAGMVGTIAIDEIIVIVTDDEVGAEAEVRGGDEIIDK